MAPRSRSFVALCVLLSGVLAGCVGGPVVGSGDGPDPTDERAVERALAAEEEYVVSALESASCVESWGLTPYGGIEENGTVADRTGEGVVVTVTHPYWYGTEELESDGGTEARYRVTAGSVERLDGTELAPC